MHTVAMRVETAKAPRESMQVVCRFLEIDIRFEACKVRHLGDEALGRKVPASNLQASCVEFQVPTARVLPHNDSIRTTSRHALSNLSTTQQVSIDVIDLAALAISLRPEVGGGGGGACSNAQQTIQSSLT